MSKKNPSRTSKILKKINRIKLTRSSEHESFSQESDEIMVMTAMKKIMKTNKRAIICKNSVKFIVFLILKIIIGLLNSRVFLPFWFWGFYYLDRKRNLEY